ncbi:MAG: hypothetical protein JM57_10915 [Comamonadaceae bacterium BICA1-1]|nr:MAG: hypothetical protein JM57_10915 [Comamonadaceae bacterium BICA1-1]
MKAALALLQTRWRALSQRERRAAAFSVAVLLAFVLWQWAIAPAVRTLQAAPVQHAAALAQWQQMQALAAQAQALQQAQSAAAPSRLATLQALQALNQSHLGPQASIRTQPDALGVAFSQASPQALAEWLQAVRLNTRLLPLRAELQRADAVAPAPANPATVLWSGTVWLGGAGLGPP